MDSLYILAILFALFLIILTLLYYYFTWNFDYWAKQGVPYVKPVPVLGNLEIFGKKRLEEIDMIGYKKCGRTYGIFEGREPALIVGDPDLLKQLLLKDCFTTFPNHRPFELPEKLNLLSKTLFNLNDEEWKIVRNILTPTFTSGKLKHMVELMEDCIGKVNEHIDKFANNKEPINVVNYFKCYTLDVIASCVFGVELNSLKNTNNPFIKHSKQLFETSNIGMILFFAFPKLSKIFGNLLFNQESLDFFKNKVLEIIEFRKKNKEGRKCFVDLLMQAQAAEDKENKQVLTEDILIAQCIIFLFAGLETSATALSFIAYNLATNNEIQEKLLSEIDEMMENTSDKITYDTIKQLPYLDMVINETLRMYPPLTRVDRVCNADNYKLGNATLNKSMMVTIPIYCIHYDEEFYPNPHEFNPERFTVENKANRNSYTYLPFGAGPRSCIGSRFALMEIKLGLVHLLSKYRFVTCAETQIPVKLKVSTGELLSPDCISLVMENRNEN